MILLWSWNFPFGFLYLTSPTILFGPESFFAVSIAAYVVKLSVNTHQVTTVMSSLDLINGLEPVMTATRVITSTTLLSVQRWFSKSVYWNSRFVGIFLFSFKANGPPSPICSCVVLCLLLVDLLLTCYADCVSCFSTLCCCFHVHNASCFHLDQWSADSRRTSVWILCPNISLSTIRWG